jgi:small multidrug resistance family-3 protein
LTTTAWLIFIAAATLEVAGDAIIRKGLHINVIWLIVAGFLMLGGYGLVVNMVKWDFSKLLGVYVAIFAAVSILAGRFVFKETIPTSTWLGLAIIVAGGSVIQFGPQLGK